MSNSYRNLGISINVFGDSDKKVVTTSSFIRGGDPVFITLNQNYLVNLLGSTVSIPSLWKKVILSYRLGYQRKLLTFRYRGSNLQCYTSWGTFLNPGVWGIREANVVNLDGAYQRIDSTYFSSNDNITLS